MQTEMTERERIVRTLRGDPCDKIPWATRLDIWHTAATRSRTLPLLYEDMDSWTSIIIWVSGGKRMPLWP